MNRFILNNWVITTDENYIDPLFGTDETNRLMKSIENINVEETSSVQRELYLYRAPMASTKMVGYLPHAAIYSGETENLKLLYNQQSEIMDSVLAVNINWFEHRFKSTQPLDIIHYLESNYEKSTQKKRVTLLGLGDVGSILAIGLKLLGGDAIESLGIYDISDSQKARWEMELGQITVNSDIRVHAIAKESLFEGDMFVFCASKFVPKVGEEVKDVRMIQFEENAKLIAQYAVQAREANFKGIFAVVSDPVDLLCKQVWLSSNRSGLDGTLDFNGLLPEQVVGFGLGVMDGRAHYYSKIMGMAYEVHGRVFGPHGKDLVVSENVLDETQEKSCLLTERVVTSNLEMRALGYKPYIAPAISSGANSIVRLLMGEPHYSAHFINGTYWGTRNVFGVFGVEFESIRLSSALLSRIEASYNKLGDLWTELNS